MSIQGVSTASIDDCAYHRCLVLPAVMQGIFATGKSNIIIIYAVASCLIPDVLSASILLMRLLLMDLLTSVYMVLFPIGVSTK